MDILKSEFGRNVTGYFLVVGGFIFMLSGHHLQSDKMQELGGTLVTAALLAFQAKRSPDGNTSTVQYTTPASTDPAPVLQVSTSATPQA